MTSERAGGSASVAPVRVQKLPVEHEAMFFDGTHENVRAVVEWVQPGRQVGDRSVVWADRKNHRPEDEWWLWLRTLHGTVQVAPGTWVVKGERDAWPVDAEQFEATYAVVSSLDTSRESRDPETGSLGAEVDG